MNDTDEIFVRHCFKCGGTGLIFNEVPGSMLIRPAPPLIMPPNIYQPKSEKCSNCKGTGHILGKVV